MAALQATLFMGFFQARVLEWGAIAFSSAWKGKVKVKSLSRVWLFMTPWSAAYQAPPSMGFSRQEYWSGVPLPSPSWSLESGKWVQNICYSNVLHQSILISPKILSSAWCITIKLILYPLLTLGKKQMYLDLIFKERHISERTTVTLKLWSVSVNNLKLVYNLKSYWVQMLLNFLELNY